MDRLKTLKCLLSEFAQQHSSVKALNASRIMENKDAVAQRSGTLYVMQLAALYPVTRPVQE